MSKLKFDYALIDQDGEILLQGEVANTEEDILQWLKTLSEYVEGLWSKTLVCIEHSGYYNARLLHLLYKQVKANIWQESGLQIRRSSGL